MAMLSPAPSCCSTPATRANQVSESIARVAVAAANSTLAEYQRIHTWVFWPEPDFPRTSTGKPRLSKFSLAPRRFLSGNAGADHVSKNSSGSAYSSESLDQLVASFHATFYCSIFESGCEPARPGPRSAPYLTRSRRVDERAGTKIPSRTRRNGFLER